MKNFSREDSKGEKIIKEYLDKNDIFYSKKESWWFGGKRFVPDFVIFYSDDKNDFMGVIEFDGKPGHFAPIECFGGKKVFLEHHNSDLEKDYFLEEERVPLLRIRYDQIDIIEELLTDFIQNPTNYLHKHSKDNWDTYYKEWTNNFKALYGKEKSD